MSTAANDGRMTQQRCAYCKGEHAFVSTLRQAHDINAEAVSVGNGKRRLPLRPLKTATATHPARRDDGVASAKDCSIAM